MQKQTMFLATLCLLIGPAAVPGQAQTGGVNVNVPFKFEVGDRTLPEGQYLIWSAKDDVFIQRSDGQTVAMVLSNAVTGRAVGDSGQVVFRCYDQHCFLSELWSPTQQAGRELLRGRREKELAKKETATFFAFVGTPKLHQDTAARRKE